MSGKDILVLYNGIKVGSALYPVNGQLVVDIIMPVIRLTSNLVGILRTGGTLGHRNKMVLTLSKGNKTSQPILVI